MASPQPRPPALVFASAGAGASPSALCGLPSHRLVLHASGPNVVVVDTAPAAPRVAAVLATRPDARVAGVAACAAPGLGGPVIAAAALSDGALAVFARHRNRWGVSTLVDATGGGGKDRTPLVSVCALFCAQEGRCCVVTAAMDDARGAGLCVVWALDEVGEFADEAPDLVPRAVARTKSTPDHFLPECVAATLVDGRLLVALAGTDRAVRLYQRDGADLVPLSAPLLGHRDWVRGLCFSGQSRPEGSFLLATASTDASVRVWTFRPEVSGKCPPVSPGGLDGDGGGGQLDDADDSNRARVHVSLDGKPWSATLDALLTEHDRAVLSVSFADDGAAEPALLTASMDGSVALWTAATSAPTDAPPRAGGVVPGPTSFCVAARFGLLGGSGASALGFSAAVFATPGVDRVIAHTLGGTVHSWRRAPKDSSGDSGGARFLAGSAPGGHVAPVNAVAWDPLGRYLMSCGEDKTTRVYVPHPPGSSQFVEWARPQVHGHPICDVAFLAADGLSFASVSEEKVLRLFDAPRQFTLPGSAAGSAAPAGDDAAVPSHRFAMSAVSAATPELGLSNKPVYADSPGPDAADDGGDEGGGQAPFGALGDDTVVTSFGAERAAASAPLEVELRQDRLWPERAKLYGHGNNVCCVAVELSSGVLASASHAQASRDAFVVLWDIASGVERARLFAHDLTVNQLQFSPDGAALLSVSRDRSFAVFARRSESPFSFGLAARQQMAHSRLLHTGCWAGGTSLIATGSRDKHVKLWLYGGTTAVEVGKRKFDSGVTALDATAPGCGGGRDRLAIGLEDGAILIARVVVASGPSTTAVLHVQSAVSQSLQCCGRVTRLAWRPCGRDVVPVGEVGEGGADDLAASSADHSVRVFHVPA
jgi:elongator complex protein 2